MVTVKYGNITRTCAVALKGTDYIHLLDDSGNMIASFDGISSFSGFTITGGSWTTPTADNNCHLAVLREDGTLGRGNHRCSDIPTKLEEMSNIVVCETEPTTLVEGTWYLVKSEV